MKFKSKANAKALHDTMFLMFSLKFKIQVRPPAKQLADGAHRTIQIDDLFLETNFV